SGSTNRYWNSSGDTHVYGGDNPYMSRAINQTPPNLRTQKPRVKCPICLKTFMRKQALGYHMNIHTGEKPFKCKLCPKSFPNPGTLNKHTKRHQLGLLVHEGQHM
ncbi:unnamed protein product, partial [Owenia fusiformis]